MSPGPAPSAGPPFGDAPLRRGTAAFGRVVGGGRDLAHRLAEPDRLERGQVPGPDRHLLDGPLRERRALQQALRQAARGRS